MLKQRAVFNFFILLFQKSYEALPLDQKTTLLFSALPAGGDVPEEGRQLAAVMLRRLLSTGMFNVHEYFGPPF